VGVGGVFGDRQVSLIAQDLIEHVGRFAFGRDDHPGAEHRVLIGDMGIGGQPLVGEIPAQRPGGDRLALRREALPVTGGQGAAPEDRGQR